MQKIQRFVADQRFDLPHYEAMMGWIADEFSAYNKAFISPTNYIVKNWKVEVASGLTVRVNNSADSLLINSERVGYEQLQYRPSGLTLLNKTLEDNATNYVELQIGTATTGEDAVAIWDPTAASGAGGEFIQNVDTVTCEEPTLISNTIAFSVASPHRIRLAVVVTSGGSIVSITDARKFLFKHYVNWSFGGTRTDTTIGSLKDNDDALKTILREVIGGSDEPTTPWYTRQGASTLDLLRRMNYILVDGGNISWSLPKPAKGSLKAVEAHPSNYLKDGDLLVISDGTTAVTFEFDSNASVAGGNTPITITANATAAAVKTAIISAINGHAFGVTASSGTGNRIELVNDANGTAGNVAITETMQNATSLSPEGMAGGVSTTSLTWTAALKIVAPGRAYSYSISAQTVANLADGEVAYVTLPDEGTAPSGALAVSKVAASAYSISQTAVRGYILAYRSGSKIYFGNGWQSVELEDGETNQLGDGPSSEILTAMGLTSEFQSKPPYTSGYWVSPGASFTTAISELDTIAESVWQMVTGKVYDETIISDGSPAYEAGAFVTLPPPFGAGANQTYQTGYNQLQVFFNGRKVIVGADWAESANVGAGIGDRIQLLVDVPNNTKITFRIQTGGGQTGTVSSATADIYDEGVLVAAQAGQINFIGPGVRVEQPAPNQANVIVGFPRELAKLCKNATGATLSAGTVVAWLGDGTIAKADADDPTLADICGVVAETILHNAFGLVIKAGNVPGVLASLGATPGQAVYLSETPGGMTLTSPGDLTDTVIRLGRAEPGDGVASATANDLWLAPQVIQEP